MAKFKPTKVVKYYAGEKYTFVGGKALVPGMSRSGKPVTVTLKEFKELCR